VSRTCLYRSISIQPRRIAITSKRNPRAAQRRQKKPNTNMIEVRVSVRTRRSLRQRAGKNQLGRKKTPKGRVLSPKLNAPAIERKTLAQERRVYRISTSLKYEKRNPKVLSLTTNLNYQMSAKS
jgi:hypothetical protein